MNHKKMSVRKGVDLEVERERVEQIERAGIEYEHRARMARTSLYGTVPPRDAARGWVDATRK